jgi:hypothetical protein
MTEYGDGPPASGKRARASGRRGERLSNCRHDQDRHDEQQHDEPDAEAGGKAHAVQCAEAGKEAEEPAHGEKRLRARSEAAVRERFRSSFLRNAPMGRTWDGFHLTPDG